MIFLVAATTISVSKPTATYDYKPKKIAGGFHDKYVECKSECGDGELKIEEYLENIGLYLHDIINDLKNLANGKFVWKWKWTS